MKKIEKLPFFGTPCIFQELNKVQTDVLVVENSKNRVSQQTFQKNFFIAKNSTHNIFKKSPFIFKKSPFKKIKRLFRTIFSVQKIFRIWIPYDQSGKKVQGRIVWLWPAVAQPNSYGVTDSFRTALLPTWALNVYTMKVGWPRVFV